MGPCRPEALSCLPILKMSGHLHLLSSYCIPSCILSIREEETSKIWPSPGGAEQSVRDRLGPGEIQTNDPGLPNSGLREDSQGRLHGRGSLEARVGLDLERSRRAFQGERTVEQRCGDGNEQGVPRDSEERLQGQVSVTGW